MSVISREKNKFRYSHEIELAYFYDKKGLIGSQPPQNNNIYRYIYPNICLVLMKNNINHTHTFTASHRHHIIIMNSCLNEYLNNLFMSNNNVKTCYHNKIHNFHLVQHLSFPNIMDGHFIVVVRIV